MRVRWYLTGLSKTYLCTCPLDLINDFCDAYEHARHSPEVSFVSLHLKMSGSVCMWNIMVEKKDLFFEISFLLGTYFQIVICMNLSIGNRNKYFLVVYMYRIYFLQQILVFKWKKALYQTVHIHYISRCLEKMNTTITWNFWLGF